jgi:hypothetical protein
MFYNISFNKDNLSWFGLNKFLAFIILLSFVFVTRVPGTTTSPAKPPHQKNRFGQKYI